MPAQTMQAAPPLPADMEPTYWGQSQSQSQSRDFSSDSASPLSTSRGLHLSPTASATTHGSLSGSYSEETPPAQTPQLDSDKRGSLSEQRSDQKTSNDGQSRASVAVACVPCRSRHLKCDGGVRCSRCRADNAECTYIKSRRGWKGKRKNRGDTNASMTMNGKCTPALTWRRPNTLEVTLSSKLPSTAAISHHQTTHTAAMLLSSIS